MNNANDLPEAFWEMLVNICDIISRMAEEMKKELEKIDAGADPRQELPERIEIQHVGYDSEQCGREK